MNEYNKHLVYSALIAAGALVVFKLVFALMGKAYQPIDTMISITINVSAVLFALNYNKRAYLEGVMSFKQAFKGGFKMILIIAPILAVYTYFDLKYISINYLPDLMVRIQETYLQLGVEEETVEMISIMFEKMLTPAVMAFSSIFNRLFWGAILCLIVAAIVKQQPNPLLNSEKE